MERTLPPFYPHNPESPVYPGYWVGSNDGFAPQLTIRFTFSKEELERAQQERTALEAHFTSRTDDMDVHDPDDDEGSRHVVISDLMVNDDGSLNFFATIDTGEEPVYSHSIWVWNYYPEYGSGRADFEAEG